MLHPTRCEGRENRLVDPLGEKLQATPAICVEGSRQASMKARRALKLPATDCRDAECAAPHHRSLRRLSSTNQERLALSIVALHGMDWKPGFPPTREFQMEDFIDVTGGRRGPELGFRSSLASAPGVEMSQLSNVPGARAFEA